jgi:hypothetical protein
MFAGSSPDEVVLHHMNRLADQETAAAPVLCRFTPPGDSFIGSNLNKRPRALIRRVTGQPGFDDVWDDIGNFHGESSVGVCGQRYERHNTGIHTAASPLSQTGDGAG